MSCTRKEKPKQDCVYAGLYYYARYMATMHEDPCLICMDGKDRYIKKEKLPEGEKHGPENDR